MELPVLAAGSRASYFSEPSARGADGRKRTTEISAGRPAERRSSGEPFFKVHAGYVLGVGLRQDNSFTSKG